MNCLDVLDRLGALAAGTVPAPEREEAERHAASCSACADLLRDARNGTVRGEEAAPALAEDEAAAFVGAVLGQTSGSACRRAEELLGDLAFDQATPDAQLLAAHVEHCDRCAALAESLRLAARVLPTFASADPGPAFTAAVLAATSRAWKAELPAGRLLAAWHRWQARPRFAFELAYVATLLLVLVIGNPIVPLQASARTVTVAVQGLERARSAWPAAVPRLEVPASVRELSGMTGEVLGRNSTVGQVIEAVWQKTAAWCSSAWAWLQGSASTLISGVKAIWAGLEERAAPERGGSGEPGARRAR